MTIYTDDCKDYYYVLRYWLACSNLIFLSPIIYCIRLTIYGHKKWFTLVPEMFLLTCVMVFSFLYHMCDDSYGCTSHCVTSWTYLNRLDFIFSYQTISVVVCYSVDPDLTPYKFGFLASMLAINTIYVTAKDEGTTFSENDYFILMICVVSVVAGAQLYYYYRKGTLAHELKYHLDWRMAIPAILFFIAGVTIKLTTSDESEEYSIMHPFWHICMAIGITFAFATYDTNVLCFCWCCKKKKYCSQCDNNSDIEETLPR
jgi:hypothetical protein